MLYVRWLRRFFDPVKEKVHQLACGHSLVLVSRFNYAFHMRTEQSSRFQKRHLDDISEAGVTASLGEPVSAIPDLFLAESRLSRHPASTIERGKLKGQRSWRRNHAMAHHLMQRASFSGGVAEWPIAPVLKTGDVERRSRVRISPPPLYPAKT